MNRIDLADFSVLNPPPQGAYAKAATCPGLRRVRLCLPHLGYLSRDRFYTVLHELTHYPDADHFEPFAIGVLGNVHRFERKWGIPIEADGEMPDLDSSFFQFIDPPSMWEIPNQPRSEHAPI